MAAWTIARPSHDTEHVVFIFEKSLAEFYYQRVIVGDDTAWAIRGHVPLHLLQIMLPVRRLPLRIESEPTLPATENTNRGLQHNWNVKNNALELQTPARSERSADVGSRKVATSRRLSSRPEMDRLDSRRSPVVTSTARTRSSFAT